MSHWKNIILAGLVTSSFLIPQEAIGMTKNADYQVIRERPFIDVTDTEKLYEYLDKKYEDDERQDLSIIEGSEQFKEDYNNFAYKIFEKLMKQGNVIFSPSSAYVPLSELVYSLNKDSNIQQELKELLFSQSDITYYWTDDLINKLEDNQYLINGSIWLGKPAEPNIKWLQDNLSSDIFKIDFQDANAVKIQMDWVNKWTKGSFNREKDKENFKDTSKSDADLAVRLVGTTYLKTNWQNENYKLVSDKFYNEGKSKKNKFKKIKFIHNGSYQKMLYHEDKDLQAFKIPMKNRSNLVVFLPKKDKINADKITKVMNSEWEMAEVKFWLPKLKDESSLDLISIFKSLGIQDLFEPNTGYDNYLGEDALGLIGEIKQETKVEMDNKGFEGASYTKVDMLRLTSAIADEKEMKRIEIKVNRPYLFLVEHDGFTTFMGYKVKF